MLDGILGRGFASKCKSLIKMTKSRIEVILRKRNATLKFLKKDMADLLANGLDINAYGRAGGLLAELILSSCYDFVEKSCDFVLKHLSVMQKMRHCPEDCREAVSSLMFAAARFSDLPELRDLRDIFYERYGNALELFVNQGLVENLSSKPSTAEKKVQLMHDIASEFGIKWDSRACEQRISKPSASVQEQPITFGSPHINDDKFKSINGKDTVPTGKHDVSPEERVEHHNHDYRLHYEKESNVSKRNEFNPQSRYEVPGNRYKLPNVRDQHILKRDIHDGLFQGRQNVAVEEKHEPWKEDTPLKTVKLGSSSQRKIKENFDAGSKLHDGMENAAPKRDGLETLTCGKPDILPSYTGSWLKGDGRDSVAGNHGSQYNAASSAQDVQEEGHKLNLYYNNAIPSPYTKPNAKLKDGKNGGSLGYFFNGLDGNVSPKDHSRDNRADAANRSEKILQEAYHLDHEMQSVGPPRANGNGHENDNKHQNDGVYNAIPKPRSSRRRHSKSHTNHDGVGNSEDTGIVKRRSRSRRRDDSRRGLQVLFDDEHYRNDEEERIIDKLLIHYSQKPSAYEPRKVRRKSKSHHSHHQDIEEDKSSHHIGKDGPNEISEMLPPPRSISLPREQTAPSEATKVYARAASFQPDRSSPAKHVHPKLPDYDDLAARFAALKGR